MFVPLPVPAGVRSISMSTSMSTSMSRPMSTSTSTSTSMGWSSRSHGPCGTKQEHAGTAKPQALAHGETLGQ